MTAPDAHETAAVLRMHRAGMSAPKICGLLGMSKTQLIYELRIALDDEQEANELGMPIQDEGIAPVDGVEKYAKDVLEGEYLLGFSYVESVDFAPAHYDSVQRMQDPGRVTIKLIDAQVASFSPYDKVRVYLEEQPAPKDNTKHAKDVMPGEYLVEHSAYVWTKNVDGSLITFTLPTGQKVSYGANEKIKVSEGRQ